MLLCGDSETVFAGAASPQHRPPPIVVVLIDTLRRDHVGCYGYGRATTPNLDRLASEGIVYEQAMSASNWTVPAVASLFTGLGPQEHGAIAIGGGIEPGRPTIASALRSAGYRTAAFVDNPHLRAEFGFDQGFETYWPPRPPSWIGSEHGIVARILRRLQRRGWGGDSEETVRRAEQWLANGDPRPPFLYVHLLGPHAPYERDAEDVVFGAAGWQSGDPPTLSDFDRPAGWSSFRDLENPPVVGDSVLSAWIDLYDGEIARADHLLGDLLRRLDRCGLYDESIIVVLSDHGEEFGDHGGWRHGLTLYEEVVGVPLVARLPHGEFTGARADGIVSVVDLASGLLRCSGVGAVGSFEGGVGAVGAVGASCSDVTPGRLLPSNGYAFSARPPYLWGLREGNWKLVLTTTPAETTLALFDLTTDALEQRDVAGTHPEVVERMSAVLAMLAMRSRAASDVGNSIPPADTREALRGLGYIE